MNILCLVYNIQCAATHHNLNLAIATASSQDSNYFNHGAAAASRGPWVAACVVSTGHAFSPPLTTARAWRANGQWRHSLHQGLAGQWRRSQLHRYFLHLLIFTTVEHVSPSSSYSLSHSPCTTGLRSRLLSPQEREGHHARMVSPAADGKQGKRKRAADI